MKTIQLQVDDNNYESFLNIIQNLKDGFIKNFKVSSDEKQKIDLILEADDKKEILSILSCEDFTTNEDFKSKFNL